MTLVVVAAVLAAVATLPVTAGSQPIWWRDLAEFVVPVGFLVAVGGLIVADSAARGRSGWGWLAVCVLLAPVALPAFMVVAVADRLHGRLGIESRWAPAGRWFLLAGVVLAVVAVVPAVAEMQVPTVSASVPEASGSFPGSCSSALSVSLGGGPYGQAWPTGAPPALAAARATMAGRCSAAAADRMTASAMCLGGAVLLALAGQGMNRRRAWRQRRRGPVFHEAC